MGHQSVITSSAMISFISATTMLTILCQCQGGRVARDTYGQPAAAPVEAYAAPETAPAPAPAYTAPEAGLDLTTLAIPVIILVGVFLLFPSFTTLTSVRKTLKMAEREDGQMNILDQIQDVYQALMEDTSMFGLQTLYKYFVSKHTGEAHGLHISVFLLLKIFAKS